MASISGSVTIAGDPDDWIAVAWDADTHAYAGVATVSGGAYEITGLTAGKAYVVGCRPKSGPAWAAARLTTENDYTVPSDPVSNPYLFKATGIGDTDTDFASVALLLNCDGADGSTTFTDRSPDARTVTANGNAHVETDQSQWGGAALGLDGTGDYLSLTGESFGTDNFTIEAWIRVAAPASSFFILDTRNADQTNTGFVFYVRSTKKLTFGRGSPFTATEGTTDVPVDTWRHVALTRSGTTVRGYLNGAKEFETTDSRSFSLTTWHIGQSWSPGTISAGYMDDVRITTGVARYTGDTLTVPTGAFPSGALTNATEPTWPTTPGNTVVDGDVTWTNMGAMVRPLMHGPLIAA